MTLRFVYEACDRLGLAIVGLDQAERIALCSPQMTDLSTAALLDLDDLLAALCLSTGEKRTVKAAVAAVRNDAGETQMVELRPRRDGEPPRTFVAQVFRVGHSEEALVLLAMEDTSKGSRARLELEELTRLASLGQIAAGVAHEFNNILTSVLGWTQIARQSAEGQDSLSSALEIIEGNARRAKDIAARLLDSSHNGSALKESICISEVVDDILKLLSWEMNTGGIHVTRRFEQTPLCWGDSHQLGQVFINIIRNAMDAMPEGGGLQVSIDQRDGDVVVTFVDSGPGMPQTVVSRIFDPFFSTKSRNGDGRPGGTGLGLAISKDIIEQHGGRLEVDSAPGSGTRFTVRLQASPEKRPTPENHSNDLRSVPPGISVLVADDEPDIGEMIHTALTLKGVNVMRATRGNEAIELCRSNDFDAAFVDFTMPGLSGHRLGKELAAVRPEMAIVYMSGREVEMRADLEIADFLKKPFDLNDIQGKLREVLELRARGPVPGDSSD